MSLTLVSCFVGVTQTNAIEQVTAQGGVRPGDVILSVIEVSPSPGTDRTSLFGKAAFDNDVIIQQAGVTNIAGNVMIATFLREST